MSTSPLTRAEQRYLSAPTPAKHLLSLLEFALHRAARGRADRSTLLDCNRELGALGLPAGLELQWLGTASFRLSYQGYDLLIDPYLTRAPLARVIGRAPLLANARAVDDAVHKADAIVVGHTHFDHALDTPRLVQRFGCKAYGSRSLQQLLGVFGQAEHAVVVEPGRVVALGPFEVRFVESLHSKLMLGLAVPMGGELTCDHLDHLNGGAYRCGATYGIHITVAGTTLYHQGSANLIDANVPKGGVDVFLCGIAGRGFTPRYTERMLRALQPRVIVPHHFDDFFRPNSENPGFSLNVNLAGFVDEVAAVSKDFCVKTLLPTQTVR